MNFILVFISGGVGATLRFFLIKTFEPWKLALNFPLGTVIVNLTSCFLAGILFYLLFSKLNISESMKIMLFTGFLGGFSTFSAVSIDIIELIESGNWFNLGIYFISVLLALIAGVFGYHLIKIII